MAGEPVSAGPSRVIPNRDRIDKSKLKVFSVSLEISYGSSGLVIVVAENKKEALDIVVNECSGISSHNVSEVEEVSSLICVDRTEKGIIVYNY